MFRALYRWFNVLMDWLTPIGDLILRVWIAEVFFFSGLTKYESWSSTLQLFKHEYSVPLLSPEIAAYFGTAAELILPIFLVLGLGGRIPAFGLFIFNIVATISYPFLWTGAGAQGLHDHFVWGLVLMTVTLHGTGAISFDYIINGIRGK